MTPRNKRDNTLSKVSDISTGEFQKLFDTESGAEKQALTYSNYQKQSLLRPEMHMFLWPYFLLDKNANRKESIEIHERVNAGDNVIDRKWLVKPHPTYGMPGPLESAVLLALYEIAYENYISKGLSVPEWMPIGSWRAFLEKLGMSQSGRSQAEVKLALKRLVHTTCHSENSFFDKAKNLYVTEAFQILQAVMLKGETDGNGEKIEFSMVRFHPRIMSNLNARYLMILDRSFFKALKTATAKHLYPLLSYWFYRNKPAKHWRVEYIWLAQRLGIKVWDKLWRAKQQLKPAIDELLRTGYLADVKWEERHIVFYSGDVYSAEQLRRTSSKPAAQQTPKQLTLTLSPVIEQKDDHLMPILNIFAQGLPLADKMLSKHNLTPSQAKALCIEHNIPITRTDI